VAYTVPEQIWEGALNTVPPVQGAGIAVFRWKWLCYDPMEGDVGRYRDRWIYAHMTKQERDRAYRVLMYGLSEENRIIPLSKEELLRRQKEIYEDCYGKKEVVA
jgi:hypothetical protein